MELVSKLNYDICKIIEKYTAINTSGLGNNKKYHGNDNCKYIMIHDYYISFFKYYNGYKLHYSYWNFETDIFTRFFYSELKSPPGKPNIKQHISTKEFFKKLNDINLLDSEKWNSVRYVHISGYNKFPRIIYKQNLKKICIDFLFDKNF